MNVRKKKQRNRIIIGFLVFLCFSFFPNQVEAATSKKEWYQISHTIAHAGGGIKDSTYTNSVEALKSSLKKGKRLIELDFLFTTDHVLVCKHSWSEDDNRVLSKDEFQKKKIQGKYTTQTAEQALKTLSRYKDVYLIVDSKEKEIASVYQELKRLCIKMNRRDFLKHIVVQLYYRKDYVKIKAVYPFQNWIFTIYKIKPKKESQYQDIAAFCKKHKIKVVTMPANKVTKSRMKLLKKYNLLCMAHTVNSKNTYQKLRKLGVTAVYTDYL